MAKTTFQVADGIAGVGDTVYDSETKTLQAKTVLGPTSYADTISVVPVGKEAGKHSQLRLGSLMYLSKTAAADAIIAQREAGISRNKEQIATWQADIKRLVKLKEAK